jgi:hypothetical protein
MTNGLLLALGPIIEPLLLMFAPIWAWERVYRAQRSFLNLLFLFVVPLLALSTVGEAYRLVCWGMLQGEFAHRKAFPLGPTVVSRARNFSFPWSSFSPGPS